MEVQIVECNKIDEIKTGKELRVFSRDFAIKLAESIKVDGLLQPIVVRPNPEQPGRFIRVAGKHRHAAVHKILKEQFIRATVLEDFDPKDHEMAMISENLWHNPLTKNQMTLSIKKWYEYFAAKHGEQRPATELAREAKKAKADAQPTVDAQADAESAEESVATDEVSANFVTNVSESTGVAKRTAQRLVRLAKLFSEDELETFSQCRVTQEDQERIAKVKDAALRSQIVSLVASGMVVEDAFKEVLPEDETPKPAHAEREADRKAKSAATEEKAPTLTDDEWYTLYCGEKAALITADHAKFKSDALFYRAISEARNVFHSKIKKILAAHKLPAGQNGPFYHQVKKVANASHPKDWFICGGCNANGRAVDGDTCSECYGAAYKTKTEDY